MSRVSHMEACITCGSTTSSAVTENPEFEEFADKFIELAVRSGDLKALNEFSKRQLERVGCWSTSGGSHTGPGSLHKMRRIRLARKALSAAEDVLAGIASDEHHFDSNGHLQ